jgi:hypothetical protein
MTDPDPDGEVLNTVGPVRAFLVGAFKLTTPDGEEVAVSNRRARALLAMLCLAPDEPIDRDHLSKLLWPGGQGFDQVSRPLENLRLKIEAQLRYDLERTYPTPSSASLLASISISRHSARPPISRIPFLQSAIRRRNACAPQSQAKVPFPLQAAPRPPATSMAVTNAR